MSENEISQEELEYRKRCLTDFRRFEPNIPDRIKDILNTTLAEEGRLALLEVLILAVQAGRMIQLEDTNFENAQLLARKVEEQINKQSLKRQKLSPLAEGLLDVEGRELRRDPKLVVPEGKPANIVVIPDNVFPINVKH